MSEFETVVLEALKELLTRPYVSPNPPTKAALEKIERLLQQKGK